MISIFLDDIGDDIFKSGDALHELAKCGFMRSCQALDNLPNRLLS